MTFKRSFAGAAAAATVLGLTACAGGAAPTNTGSTDGGSDTVTFRSWSPIDQTTKQMIEAFEADNEGAKIEATIFNYPEYLVDLQSRGEF